MRLRANILRLSALLVLCGCGGGAYQRPTGGTPGGAGGVTPPSSAPNVGGNWQFNMTSSVSGGLSPTIAGSISPSGSSVNGAVHINGSNCFDPLIPVDLTGTQTGSDLSLTSTSIDGQVITVIGSIINDTLTGTYTINGGCADRDQGNVTGIKVPKIGGTIDGTFTTFTASGEERFDGGAGLTQGGASSEGSFGLTGTFTFSSPCFSSGILKSGTFPTGSFIIGTSMVLEIDTDNGTVTFQGTLNPITGEVGGDYKVVGGTCDHTGTALLLWDPWGY
jgi:hypothetical protein